MERKHPELKEELEVIRRNVGLEARLIDDLLDLTRIARGKIMLDRTSLDIGSTVARAVEVCRPDIETRRLHIGVEILGGPHHVLGDASRLQQVFWNLLKNSIKFTKVGGCIGVKGYAKDEKVIIEVIDDGIGIDPVASKKIFDAFEQGDHGASRQFGGLGLGLAISKRLVELHEGTITAESEGSGKGALFRVVLPLLAAQAPVQKLESVPPVQNEQRSARILLVEDHGDTAQMMSALLEISGYRVETAGDVAEGLKAARTRDFDLLISDLGLPDRSGLELMKELRETGSMLKGIALSGFGREEDVRRSMEAGFVEHLTKPIDFEVLASTVERVTKG